MKNARILATVFCFLMRAAEALAIAKPAPGDAPAVAPHTGPPPSALGLAGLLVALVVGTVVWWYRTGRKR